MSKDSPIAFFDSGVGGLPYLRWAMDRLPAERFEYLADNAHFPYGTKGHDELLGMILDSAEAMIAAFRPKAFVVACNTASVTALEALRNCHPEIPFVGTVPAIKPAAERSRKKRIGFLATRRTVNDPYSQRLVDKFASGCEVVKVAGTDIVEFVERRNFSATEAEREAVIAEAAEAFGKAGVDEVVLACTHFLYLGPTIERMLGPGVGLVDSREGVGRQLERVLAAAGLLRDGGAGGASLWLSGDPGPAHDYARFAGLFGIGYGGALAGAARAGCRG